MAIRRGIVELLEAIPERIEVSGHSPTWRVTGGSFDAVLDFANAAYDHPVVIDRTDRGRWWPRITLTVTTDPALAAAAPPLASLVNPEPDPQSGARPGARPGAGPENGTRPPTATPSVPRQHRASPGGDSFLDDAFARQQRMRRERGRIPPQRRGGGPVPEDLAGSDGDHDRGRDEQPPPVLDPILPAEGEHLADGWEPDAPPGDTLKRSAVLVHASWPVAVAEALGRPCRRTDRWAGALVGESGALTNPVVLTRPVGEHEAAEVVSEIGELIPPGTPYFLLSPWQTPDLAPHGLTLIGHPPLMLRLPGLRSRPDAPGVEVREVTDRDALAVAEGVLVEGYPLPGTTPGSVLGAGLLDGTTRIWLGYLDGRPVSVAAAHLAAGVTLVEYVAALPAARGRGAGAAVTWAATLADPDRPAVLVASDDGRPTYERMGFLPVERWSAWLRAT